jgi:hypothetical protein
MQALCFEELEKKKKEKSKEERAPQPPHSYTLSMKPHL